MVQFMKTTICKYLHSHSALHSSTYTYYTLGFDGFLPHAIRLNNQLWFNSHPFLKKKKKKNSHHFVVLDLLFNSLI